MRNSWLQRGRCRSERQSRGPEFQLVSNSKTAMTLGLTILPSLLFCADHAIEYTTEKADKNVSVKTAIFISLRHELS